MQNERKYNDETLRMLLEEFVNGYGNSIDIPEKMADKALEILIAKEITQKEEEKEPLLLMFYLLRYFYEGDYVNFKKYMITLINNRYYNQLDFWIKSQCLGEIIDLFDDDAEGGNLACIKIMTCHNISIGDYDEFMRYCHIGAEYGDTEIMCELGIRCMDKNEYDQGIEWFKKAVNGGNNNALQLLAKGYAHTKQVELALDTYKKIIELNTTEPSNVLKSLIWIINYYDRVDNFDMKEQYSLIFDQKINEYKNKICTDEIIRYGLDLIMLGDLNRGVKYNITAAENGNIVAMNHLIIAYMTHNEDDKIIYWADKAVGSCDTSTLLNIISWCYTKGNSGKFYEYLSKVNCKCKLGSMLHMIFQYYRELSYDFLLQHDNEGKVRLGVNAELNKNFSVEFATAFVDCLDEDNSQKYINIKNFISKHLIDYENNQVCCICCECDNLMNLNCHDNTNHILCTKCMYKLIFDSRTKCPICRRDINFI